jgi:hypothetical protein
VTEQVEAGFSRFLAGGGALSVQGIRPLARFQAGGYTRGAFVFAPRGWVNIPQLASSEDVDNYGGEVALSFLLQRYSNTGKEPFLNLEVRGSWAGGSDEFYQSIGRENTVAFLYIVPSISLAVEERVNVSISTFIASKFATDDGGVRVTFSLLNKDEPAEQPDSAPPLAFRDPNGVTWVAEVRRASADSPAALRFTSTNGEVRELVEYPVKWRTHTSAEFWAALSKAQVIKNP